MDSNACLKIDRIPSSDMLALNCPRRSSAGNFFDAKSATYIANKYLEENDIIQAHIMFEHIYQKMLEYVCLPESPQSHQKVRTHKAQIHQH